MEPGLQGLRGCEDVLVRAVRGTGMLLTAVKMITESVNDEVLARARILSRRKDYDLLVVRRTQNTRHGAESLQLRDGVLYSKQIHKERTETHEASSTPVPTVPPFFPSETGCNLGALSVETSR